MTSLCEPFFACQELVKEGLDTSNFLLTVADADVLFHPRYFSFLELQLLFGAR